MHPIFYLLCLTPDNFTPQGEIAGVQFHLNEDTKNRK
jgi:hypothetical protein